MSGSVYESSAPRPSARHCFAVLVDNEPGVLARVIGLFSGRGYNIESLTVDEVDSTAHLSRITIVTSGTAMVISQIKAQLGRLVPVRQVVNLTEQGEFIESCLAFVKVVAAGGMRDEAERIAREFGARVANSAGHAVIFELTAPPATINDFIERLRPCGLAEVARTGSTAIACGESALNAPPVARLRVQG